MDISRHALLVEFFLKEVIMIDEWVSNFLDMTDDVELEGEERKVFMKLLAEALLKRAGE
jgi:hypothetical protein